MTPSAKIVPFDAVPALCAKLRDAGSRVVLTHGLFDVLHAGYISHLQEARATGDKLIVSLTADKFVQKGPGRPFCKEQLRAQSLAALESVDYVFITPFVGAAEAISAVRPHIFCRGKEHERPSHKDEFSAQDHAAIKETAAEIRYVGSVVLSATKLINQRFDHLPADVRTFCVGLAEKFSMNDFRDAVESFADLKVLVVGDTIFDRYSFVKVQGLTSKNRIISGRFLREETQCGGALAAFRHIKQFVRHARYLSLLGPEPWVDGIMRAHLAPGEDLSVRDPAFTTVIKQRYLEPQVEGKELSKLFAVNYIDAGPPPAPVQQRVEDALRREIGQAGLVVLLDFGHGMMQPRLRDLVQDAAPLLVLNCQTNSNNHGFNVISRQYRRADAFSLDEQELMLSCGHRHVQHKDELVRLQKQLGSEYAWLTRGAVQTIGLCKDDVSLCPPLETEVVDTIGAGDAFFSVAALCAARKLPISLATFLGQLAGAQAVKIIGNEHPISKSALLNSGLSLLNF